MPPMNKTLIPGDWVRLEQLINELYALSITEDISLTDVQSEIVSNDSDIVVLKSDIAVNASDIAFVQSKIYYDAEYRMAILVS